LRVGHYDDGQEHKRNDVRVCDKFEQRVYGVPSAPVEPVIAPSDRDKTAVARDDCVDIELGFHRAVYLRAFGVPQFPAGGLVEVAHGRAAMVILRGAVGVEQLEQPGRDAALLHSGLGMI
jgi:hypothetical protein